MAAHQALPSLGFSRQEHWSGLPFPSPMHESEKWKRSRSVVPDTQWPHGLQPSRLLRPWDFPGKSTGVGCHCHLSYVYQIPEYWFPFFSHSNAFLWIRQLLSLLWPLFSFLDLPEPCPLIPHALAAALDNPSYEGALCSGTDQALVHLTEIPHWN